MRIVFDTNVVVSALLLSGSVPAQALSRAEDAGTVLISGEMLAELAGVLSRPKLKPYIDEADIVGTLARIDRSWERVAILHQVAACRDPGDDKVLETAINGRADAIVTGDRDLLVLGPFRGVAILSPAELLDRLPEPNQS